MLVNQVIHKGFVKRTVGQRKKHVSMMSKAEINYLSNRVRLHGNRWSLTSHVQRNGRLFHMTHIQELLNEDLRLSMIEYNEKVSHGKKDRRVLLRSQFAVPVHLTTKGVREFVFANLCLVMNIDTGEIITIYWNRVSDNHSTVDMGRYDETLTIF